MKNFKLLSFFSLLLVVLQSCNFDDNGDPYITSFGWIIFISIPILIIIAAIVGSIQTSKEKLICQKLDIDYDTNLQVGKYVGGHPDIDIEIPFIKLNFNDGYLLLLNYEINKDYIKAKILLDDITDIVVEDASTFEKRVTLGRAVLVGVFALAWKKNTKKESTFLTITWKSGRFEHNTIFAFEGENTLNAANSLRNKLIKIIEKKE
jgi:hypothetical protein